MSTSAAAPSVAVIGGGLSGSLAALVLRSRGLAPTIYDMGRRMQGGRMLGGRHADSGLQFLRSSDAASQLSSVLGMLAREGLVGEWSGRFGVLGARGGFLPREVLADTPLRDMMRADGAEGAAHAGGGIDFCGFLGHADEPAYVGTPSNAGICAGICEAAGILRVLQGHKVLAAHPNPAAASGGDGGSGGGGWRLDVAKVPADDAASAESHEHDAVVFASHDAALAAAAVRAVAAGADGDAAGRLAELAAALQAQRDERTAALFTWSGYFPPGFSAQLPFDAATAPSSPIVQFLARDASKPGRPADVPLPAATGGATPPAGRAELWTAVSTSGFAAELLASAALVERGDSEHGGAAAQAALAIGLEVRSLVASCFGGDAEAVPAPLFAAAKRWGAGLPRETMGLAEDCVSLEPWRMAIAGDFLRTHASPAEAAARSGLEAGERAASWFAAEAVQPPPSAPL